MEGAFQVLKKARNSPPVLAFHDFKDRFVLETDPSAFAEGAVIFQRKEDGHLHPIEFVSRTVNAAKRKYAACEREALAVVFGLH